MPTGKTRQNLMKIKETKKKLRADLFFPIGLSLPENETKFKPNQTNLKEKPIDNQRKRTENETKTKR